MNYQIGFQRPAEEIFKSIGPRTRKNIRRALNKGAVRIREIKDKTELVKGYKILRKTYRVAQVPLADRSLFEAAFDVLFPAGMVKFFLAFVHEDPVAVSIELLYKHSMCGWYGMMDRAYRSYLSNELLTWHILEWGSRNGYQLYDFGGAGRPQEKYGVRDFKAKFGGGLVSFGRHVCVHQPGRLRLADTAYRFYRRMRGSGREKHE